jgi:predicted O-linked N-acetylglucosamine transferase (SPINDLY family)
VFAESALKLDPAMAAAHIGKALSLEFLGRLEEAEASFQNAIAVAPQPSNAIERESLSRAISGLAIIREQLCLWEEREVLVSRMIDVVASDPNSIHPLHTFYFPFSNDERKKVAVAHARRAAESVGNAGSSRGSGSRGSSRGSGSRDSSSIRGSDLLPNLISLPPLVEEGRERPGMPNIRIGFVSSDFGGGVVGDYFQEVLSSFDRKRVAAHCFMTASVSGEDRPTGNGLDGCVYHDVAMMDDVALAGHIRRLRIHVLFNLDGWVMDARSTLWEIQAAPIQILLQGFPGTMGSNKMSFVMTHEDIVPPPDARKFYSERMIYTDHPLIVNSHGVRERGIRNRNLDGGNYASERRGKLGIPLDAFVLTTFSRLQKLDPSLLDVWANILVNSEIL